MATPSSSVGKSSGFPLWAKILLGLFVVLILVVLAVPYFVNVDRYRDTISDAIAKQTGRKVTLGHIHARFFPGAGVTVADLHIGNPTGFPEGDLLSADEIGVNVALAPLLHGTIHVNSVDIVHPKLTVLTDSGGKNNYTFTSPEPAAAPKSGESSSMSLDQIDSINLTGAEILVGSVIKGAAAPLADTKGINITLHNFAVSPMRMHDWQAESNLASVTLALSGWRDPIAFRTGKFTLSGGKIDAQFVADLATAADVKGTVNVPDFEHPQVNFEMSSSQLDIDKLIDVAGSGSGIARFGRDARHCSRSGRCQSSSQGAAEGETGGRSSDESGGSCSRPSACGKERTNRAWTRQRRKNYDEALHRGPGERRNARVHRSRRAFADLHRHVRRHAANFLARGPRHRSCALHGQRSDAQSRCRQGAGCVSFGARKNGRHRRT